MVIQAHMPAACWRRVQTDPDTDRPFEPPAIRDVEVLWNPFEDIVPRFNLKLQRKMAGEQAAWVCGHRDRVWGHSRAGHMPLPHTHTHTTFLESVLVLWVNMLCEAALHAQE